MTRDRPAPQAAQRRRAEPQCDPPRGDPARHGRGHRRALDQPAGRRGGDEQERPLRALRLQGGAPARDHRDGQRDLQRARARARAERADRDRAPAPADRRTTSLRRGRDVSGRLLLRLDRVRDRHAPRARCETSPSSSWTTGSALLETAVREAQAEGVDRPAEDPAQLAFELEACLFLANTLFVIAPAPRRSSGRGARSSAASPTRLLRAPDRPPAGVLAGPDDRYGGATA